MAQRFNAAFRGHCRAFDNSMRLRPACALRRPSPSKIGSPRSGAGPCNVADDHCDACRSGVFRDQALGMESGAASSSAIAAGGPDGSASAGERVVDRRLPAMSTLAGRSAVPRRSDATSPPGHRETAASRRADVARSMGRRGLQPAVRPRPARCQGHRAKSRDTQGFAPGTAGLSGTTAVDRPAATPTGSRSLTAYREAVVCAVSTRAARRHPRRRRWNHRPPSIPAARLDPDHAAAPVQGHLRPRPTWPTGGPGSTELHAGRRAVRRWRCASKTEATHSLPVREPPDAAVPSRVMPVRLIGRPGPMPDRRPAQASLPACAGPSPGPTPSSRCAAASGGFASKTGRKTETTLNQRLLGAASRKRRHGSEHDDVRWHAGPMAPLDNAASRKDSTRRHNSPHRSPTGSETGQNSRRQAAKVVDAKQPGRGRARRGAALFMGRVAAPA